MLLAIDIGNSNITLGGIQEGEILFEARLATDATKTSDEYGVEIKDMLDLFGARVEEIRDCIVASVVPPVFNSVRNGIVKLTGKEPMVVGPGKEQVSLEGDECSFERERGRRKNGRPGAPFGDRKKAGPVL